MNSSQVVWALAAILCVQAVTDGAVLGFGRRELALARALPYLISGAAGVLLATACLDLLPEAVRTGGTSPVLWQVFLVTLLALFCFEASVHSLAKTHHHDLHAHTGPPESADATRTEESNGAHHHGVPAGPSRTSPMALVLGSAIHSTVDGVAIVAAFAAGRRPGWSAALAIGLHELPHRMGDFALLVHMGVARRRAAQLAIGAGAMAILGGLAVVLFGQNSAHTVWLLPVSAATFLYIALVDLVPELHAGRQGGWLRGQALCLLAGAALVALLVHFPGE